MRIRDFFDPATNTLSYLVYDEATRDALLIDPVLDYDPASVTTSTTQADRIAELVRAEGLRLHYVLETHAHADHLSGAQYFARRFGAKTAIGARIGEVQAHFRPLFGLPDTFPTDGSQFDRLLADGERLRAGSLELEVIATPGHTPACVSYRVEDAVFVGDALFIEDYGTGRCDFPNGDARTLYRSVHERLYRLPPSTRLFVGHDYPPNGRAVRAMTTVEAEMERNVHLRAATREEDFVAMRTARDKTLSAPRLLFPSLRINIDAGRLPARDARGIRPLTLPLNALAPSEDDGSRP